MSATRVLSAVAALAAMVAAADAQFGQPGGQPFGKGAQPVGPKIMPVPLTAVLLPYVGDETFKKELKLSDEQAKKLLAFRQKVWDETYTTAPRDLKVADQYKATEAELKAVLDADQLKRATQLAAHLVWTSRGFDVGSPGPVRQLDPRTVSPSALSRHPELAAVLKLDDAQKKIAENPRGGFGTASDIYLTAEQTAAAKALLGDTPKTPLRAQTDPRLGATTSGVFGPDGSFGPSTRVRIPPRLTYLLAADVQKELKLTDDQVKAANDLRAKFPAAGRRDTTVSPADAKKAGDAVVAEVEAALAKLLTADQQKRLDQIERQQRSEWEFDEASELGKAVGVTADQRKAEAAAHETRVAAVIKAVASGDPIEKVRPVVDAANGAYDAAVAKILTADQKAKKKEWLGPPFTGSLRPAPTPFPLGGPDQPVPPGGTSTLLDDVRKATFGRYYSELSTLSQYAGVRQELKLTEEQAKKVAEANTALREKFPSRDMTNAIQGADKGEKFFADRSAFIDKSITDILTKDQQARLRELMIQQAEAGRTGPGGILAGPVVTAAALPGVAEAIKLTDDQKKKLIAGEATAQVLTDDQKKAIKGMMGKAVKVEEVFARPGFQPEPGGPGGGFGQPRPTLPRSVTIARTTAYWDPAKFTPEQVGKLATAFNEYTLATGAGRVAAEQRAAAVEAVTKAVEATLTADQRKRVEQLDLQQAAARDLASTLLGGSRATSDVKKQLAITDEQEKAIREAAGEFGELAELLDPVEYAGDEPQPRKEVTELRVKLRDRLDAKIEGLLTAEQRAKWKAMLGEPYPGFTKQPLYGGRFGGGGFGGGLGGGVGGGFEP